MYLRAVQKPLDRMLEVGAPLLCPCFGILPPPFVWHPEKAGLENFRYAHFWVSEPGSTPTRTTAHHQMADSGL
jgi:hypothetical protein